MSAPTDSVDPACPAPSTRPATSSPPCTRTSSRSRRPCRDWDVARLIAHIVAAPRQLLEMSQGGQPDWSAEPAPVAGEWAADFRAAADDLIHFWHRPGDDADAGQIDWQTAEIAVHTWDLARATGQAARLDPEVAERGLAFMSGALTPENRGEAFGQEVSAPADAPAYDRLAAFAGRSLD